jgi:hypothetical protein
MFDLGRHMSIGSSLFRILSREFHITGRANTVIAGAYFKTLFNPHPDPYTHFSNFCLKFNTDGNTHLSKELIVKSSEVCTPNFLLTVHNAALREYHGKRRSATEISDCAPLPMEKHDEESRKENPSQTAEKKTNVRKTPLFRKIEGIEAMLAAISVPNRRPEESRPGRDSERSRESNLSTISQGQKQPVQRRDTIKIVSRKETESLPKQQTTVVPPKVNTQFSGVCSGKRAYSGSGSRPSSKNAKLVGTVFSAQDYAKILASDFGGDLSAVPCGQESYEDYDSDYFERNRSVLNPKQKKKDKLLSSGTPRQVAGEPFVLDRRK